MRAQATDDEDHSRGEPREGRGDEATGKRVRECLRAAVTLREAALNEDPP